MAIGVVQMEVPFAPFCIPWPIGIESLLFQVSPKLVYLSDIENDPSPITGHVTLLEIENCIFYAERLKHITGFSDKWIAVDSGSRQMSGNPTTSGLRNPMSGEWTGQSRRTFCPRRLRLV